MELYIKLFEVLFPVFFIVGIGYFLGKKNPNFDTSFITTYSFLEKDAICNSPSSYQSGFTSFMQSVCLCSEDVFASINYWNRRSN